jgi:hypothetical protein
MTGFTKRETGTGKEIEIVIVTVIATVIAIVTAIVTETVNETETETGGRTAGTRTEVCIDGLFGFMG